MKSFLDNFALIILQNTFPLIKGLTIFSIMQEKQKLPVTGELLMEILKLVWLYAYFLSFFFFQQYFVCVNVIIYPNL